MKTSLLVLCCLVASLLRAQNLPNPTANLQNLPAGSYVIAMDNTLQANAGGYFNLKAYGLVFHLLNNSVKLHWAIKAGKSKDGIDFTAMAEQFQPTLVSGGVSRNFRAGPFVIKAPDTAGVAALITNFYTANALTGNDRPRVYRLTSAVSNVDIRFNMSGFRPKIAVLNDGANTAIHVNYMLYCSVPAASYKIAVATDLLTRCYTFASEPHNETSSNAIVNAIRKFVEYGGNFLAQCEAVTTYENHALGRFQSTLGISKTNISVSSASTVYSNPDLAYSQYEGVYDIAAGGSVRNWTLTLLSSNTNNVHRHASGTSLLTTATGASVSKLTAGALPGGLVFYIGNHEFISTTSIASINGIRMYMNAALTPNVINYDCNIGEIRSFPLAANLLNFTGTNNDEHVTLNWKAEENEKISKFELQRSSDGSNYSTIAVYGASGKTGTEIYTHTDRMNDEKGYYRLRMTDRTANVTYSSILAFKTGAGKNEMLHVLGNPVKDKLTLSFEADAIRPYSITIYDAAGRRVMAERINSYKGNNLVQYPLPASLGTGMYTVIVTDGVEKKSARFIKN